MQPLEAKEQVAMQETAVAAGPEALPPLSYALLMAAFLWGIISWRDRPPLSLCALTFSTFLLADLIRRRAYELTTSYVRFIALVRSPTLPDAVSRRGPHFALGDHRIGL